MMNNPNKKNINGILLLDKPLHITSNQALQRVKRLFGAKKAGHTGSLDPLATGMLPICFGEATKFSQYLLESDKHYRVAAQLGVKTATGDREGEVILTQPSAHVTLENLKEVLQEFFTGDVQQIPPMYSAVKYQGKPLYELARKGLEIERNARTIKVYEISCNQLDNDIFYLDVHCSKGTYIRTLVEDIAEKLATCAHVIKLHRVAVMPYINENMLNIAALEQILETQGTTGLTKLLLPIESSIHMLPTIALSTSAAFYIRTGQAVRVPLPFTDGLVRLYSDHGLFMGVGEIIKGLVTPRRLVSSSVTKLPAYS